MPAHPFGIGGLDDATQMHYLNHLIAMHTDIQSQAEKCAYYAQLAGTRASVLKHLKKQITMTEKEVEDARETCGDDDAAYDAYVSCNGDWEGCDPEANGDDSIRNGELESMLRQASLCLGRL
jgi:hypothetical protein